MTKKPIDAGAVRKLRERGRRLASQNPELTGPPSKMNRTGWTEELMNDERNDAQLVARVPASLIERIDAYATKQRKAIGENVTRGDAVRMLLTSALDREEAKPRGRRGG